MKAVLTVTWGEIDAGALIMDADGQHWRVHEKRVDLPRIALLIYHDDVAHWIVRGFSDEVVLIDETAGQSVEIVAAALGGVITVEPLPTAPNRPVLRAMYRAHLFHFHGVSISPTADKEGGTLDELIRLHAVSHASPENHLIPHVHQQIGG